MEARPAPFTAHRPKLLVLEFWGLGDLTFATPLLRAAQERYDITLVGKAHAAPLLQATFPQIQCITYDAPWSVYRDKYALWRWDWPKLLTLLRQLTGQHFEAAVSVRNDPRDHLFMFLAGARRRFGFPVKGSGNFLTHPLPRSRPKQHKVEDWRDLGRALGLSGMDEAGPQLDHALYHQSSVDTMLAGLSGKPLLCLHPGARIAVRRWPETSFAYLIEKLRAHYDFHLLLVPDPDGYGRALRPLADAVLPALSVPELVDVLGRIDLLLCNDSGPGHIAAACGRPVIPIFGPTDPDWFRPWGDQHHLVIRDICPWRPCFDYCLFAENHCLTKLHPTAAWPEIHEHFEKLIDRGILSAALRREPALVST